MHEIFTYLIFHSPIIYSEPSEHSSGTTSASPQSSPTLLPSAEKETLCTQPPPPVELENSAMRFPNGILAPHGEAVGLASMSLIHAEKIRTWEQSTTH